MSTLSFLFLEHSNNQVHFGVVTGYVFAINVVIGSGFLSLPYSFNTTGWLLASLLMIYFALQTYYLATVIVELISRVECIKQLEDVGILIKPPTFKQVFYGIKQFSINSIEIVPDITDRKFDFCDIIAIIFGPKFGKFYMCLLTIYLIGSLVSFSSIFASSFASTIPLGFKGTCNIYDDKEYFGPCKVNYSIFLFIYMCLMTWLTIIGLKEQKRMQVSLTLMRFVIIFIILITCIVLIASSSNIKNNDHVSFKLPPLFNFDNLIGALPNICFAFIYHFSIPSIVEFIKDRHIKVPKIMLLVSVTSFVVYFLLATIVPIAIHDVKPQCSIDYADYSAGHSQDSRPWWTYLISYLVVLFPAFDMVSAFPVTAVVIADNLQTFIEGALGEDGKKKKIYRVVVAVVPGVLSLLVFDLDSIISWVGLVAFILVPMVLPIAHVYTREMIKENSKFDTLFYRKWVDFGMAGINAIFLVLVLFGRAFVLFT